VYSGNKYEISGYTLGSRFLIRLPNAGRESVAAFLGLVSKTYRGE
jgi:hypothetical protein